MIQKIDSLELIMIDFQYVFVTHRNAENNNFITYICVFVPYWFVNYFIYEESPFLWHTHFITVRHGFETWPDSLRSRLKLLPSIALYHILFIGKPFFYSSVEGTDIFLTM